MVACCACLLPEAAHLRAAGGSMRALGVWCLVHQQACCSRVWFRPSGVTTSASSMHSLGLLLRLAAQPRKPPHLYFIDT